MVRLSDDRALVLTTDFFPPVVDDPRTFGRVAAANALSDVFAMGGRPLAALNLVGFPRKLDLEILAEILEGGAEKVHEAGALVAGGHTVEDHEIKYGLAVTGVVHPDRVVRNHGMRPGDVLVLTKPLGTGLITSSIKVLRNSGPVVDEAIRWMTMLNSTGLDRILAAGPSAMTDVTGFGLLGHLSEMLAGQALEVTLDLAAIPLIEGVETCFHKKCCTRGARTNAEQVGDLVELDPGLDRWMRELLFDPQTSGGLLAAVPEERGADLATALREAGLELAAVIGSVAAAAAPRIRVRSR